MMKILGFISFLLFASASILAQEGVELKSTVSEVTVYPRGAVMTHVADKALATGKQTVVFTGLPADLDPSSISVTSGKGASVLSVSSRVNHLKQQTKPKEVVMLEDSLETYEFDYKFNQNMIGVYGEEKAMILANKSVGWDAHNSDFLIEDLEDLSDYYRDRLADVMLKVMEIEEKQKRLQRDIQRVRRQLNEFNARRGSGTGEVVVELDVTSASSQRYQLSYLVNSAGWVPNYNVNVADIDKPVSLDYNAKVFQNTGIDWQGVKLKLTSANPNMSGEKPEIHPWTLYFVVNEGRADYSYSNLRLKMEDSEERLMGAQAEMFDSVEMVTEYPMNEAAVQFTVDGLQNIPSNGKMQSIRLSQMTIPAKYKYYAAPKIDPAAFLIARITDFEQYDLLPGEANLFLANTYVGKTVLDPATVRDTLELSLGRDQSIIVKRQKVKEFCSSKKIGNSKKETIGIEISVRNTKQTAITLVVEDQIPVSSNKEIEVALEEAKGANHTAETGKLKWSKKVDPGSSTVWRFRYAVKYPSDRKINL